MIGDISAWINRATTNPNPDMWQQCETDYLLQHYGRKPFCDIVIKLNRSPTTVRFHVRRLGLDKERAPNERARLKADRIARVKAVYHDHSLGEICRLLRLTESQVRAAARELGLRKRISAPPRKPEVVAQVLAMYRRKSASELGRELGITRDAVIGIARDHGLCRPRRAA